MAPAMDSPMGSRQESFHSGQDMLPDRSPYGSEHARDGRDNMPLGTTRSGGAPSRPPTQYNSLASRAPTQPPQSQSRRPAESDASQMQQQQKSVRPAFSGGRLRLRIVRALNLRNTALGISPQDVSDPFVVAKVGKQEFKTDVIENNLNPIWNSRHFEFAIDNPEVVLELEVFNSQQWHAADSLGILRIPVAELMPGKKDVRRELLDEDDAHRDDGRKASLEVEVTYLTADQVAGGRTGMAQGGQEASPLAPQSQKKATNYVPLPSFHHLGPEAFAAPQAELEEAPVGQQRRLMGTTQSRACRLGQYDYQEAPDYNPNQEEVDKRMWKDDPFYGWRRELNRAEHKTSLQPMLGDSPSGGDSTLARRPGGRGMLADRNLNDQPQDLEVWRNDPFHGWLANDKQGHVENNLEKVQEAQAARNMMRLPSFRDADKTRFSDHREYATLNEAAAATRGRWSDSDQATGQVATEKKWQKDAFFGWLPGRGPDGAQEHRLQRPLHLARDKRLPSFSEAPDLLGVTGRPDAIGILNVWINGAMDLMYDDGSGLRGKPSACVMIKVGDGPEKVTSTVPMDANPMWNTPAMTFEVGHPGETLLLEVMDLANPRSEQHIHQYFLGRVEKDVGEIHQMLLQENLPAGQPMHLREMLHGAASQDAQLDFQVTFEAYGEDPRPESAGSRAPAQALQDQGPRRIRSSPQSVPSRYSTMGMAVSPQQSRAPAERTPPPSQQPGMHRSNASFRSTASSDLAGSGVLSVRILCAYNLVNMDPGFGDVSDPYVTMRLESQDESQRKRTQTINNDLNPIWNTKSFLFPLIVPDDKLILEVWDEEMLSEPSFLGRMEVPVALLRKRPDQAIPIKDKLQGVEHGELEVEVGFSPG